MAVVYHRRPQPSGRARGATQRLTASRAATSAEAPLRSLAPETERPPVSHRPAAGAVPPPRADRSRRGRRLGHRRVSLLRDRPGTPGVDAARRPARGRPHRRRRRRPRRRRHRPRHDPPARARRRRRPRGRRLVAHRARRRDLHGRRAAGRVAAGGAPRRPQPLAVHSQRPRLDPPAQAAASSRACACLCLHPLQTFAGEPRAELLRDVPCAVTAHEERDLQLGEELAGRLGMRPFRLADEQKTALPPRRRRRLQPAGRPRERGQAPHGRGHRRRPTASTISRPLLRTTLENLLRERRPGARAHRPGGARRRGHRARPPAPARPRAPAPGARPTAPSRSRRSLWPRRAWTTSRCAPSGPARRARLRRTAGRDRGGPRDRRAHHRRDARRAAQACRGRSASCPPWARCTRATSPSWTRRGRAAPRSPPRSSSTPRSSAPARTSTRTRATRPATSRCSSGRGVDVVFAPAADEMYPSGFATAVHVGGALTEHYEGAARPGHFDGVATGRHQAARHRAPGRGCSSGEKDAQQLAVVRRLVRDLDLPVEVVGVPTVREPDGLAMSSRNAYLTAEQRAVAPDLYRALLAGRAAAGTPGATAKDVVVAATSELLMPALPRRRGARRSPARRGSASRATLRPRLPRGRRRRHLQPQAARSDRARLLIAAARLGDDPSHRQRLLVTPARTPPRTRPHERKEPSGNRHRQRPEEGPRARGPRLRRHRLHRVRQPRRRRHDPDHRRGRRGRRADRPAATAPSRVFVPGATGALTTLEFEPGVVRGRAGGARRDRSRRTGSTSTTSTSATATATRTCAPASSDRR